MAARKKQKPLLPAEQLLQRGNAEIEAHVVRRSFEQQHPDRMRTVLDRPVGRESGRTIGQSGISPKLAYGLMGYHDQEPAAPHPHGQQELPGMTSVRTARESGLLSHEATPAHQSRTLPDLAPAPKRWHEHTPEEQNQTLAALRQHGVTPESMHHSFSAQLDQGHERAAGHGMTPYAAHFYAGNDPSRPSTPDDMQPRDVLRESAKRNDVGFSTQVLANAKTSPRAKFREVRDGRTQYTNDDAANVAIQAAKSGIPHEQVIKPQGLSVTQTNVRLATNVVAQHLAGRSMEEVRNPPSKNEPHGSEPFGPKTGPYNNSFIDPHGSSQFFVSDVHSGGAGMAPHVPHEAPFERTESGDFVLTKSGNKKRPSSARENLIDTPGFHALADHVAHQVMHERGLTSLSGTQATQWGEEQVSRGEVDRGARKVTLVSQGDAYRKQPMHEEVHGQIDIFGGTSEGMRGAHVRPSSSNVQEVPTGQDRVKAEAAAAAIHRNTQAKRRRQGSGGISAKELGNEPFEGWG